MSLPESVATEIQRAFPESLRVAASEGLPASGDLVAGAPYERVLIAIVRLAKGSLDQLAYYSEQARRDWRDVLYWTQHPQEPTNIEELRRRLKLPEG
jgi:hypothetical protein